MCWQPGLKSALLSPFFLNQGLSYVQLMCGELNITPFYHDKAWSPATCTCYFLNEKQGSRSMRLAAKHFSNCSDRSGGFMSIGAA